MRKWIVSVFAIICCVLCAVSISILEKNELDSIKDLYANVSEDTDKSYNKVVIDDTAEENATENETAKELSTREDIKGSYSKYVFVGDSRYRGMMFMAQENDIFICENGRGYDYLLEQMSNIKWECDADTALIIGLGVNDSRYNVDKYITTLSTMADTMDCQIYYMLVNPVDEDVEEYNGYNVLNANIDLFNERMRNELDDRIGIIDTNSYLWDYGFETMDGLHYTNETYEKIYNFIKETISEQE